MKIYITGISGAGKSSIVRALRAKGVFAVDMDEGLCHWKDKKTGDKVAWEPARSDAWYDAHGWMCDIGELQKLLREHDPIVVVGLSSNQEHYLQFFDKVFVLHSKPETVLKRLNTRTDNIYGKHPVEQRRLLNWQQTFEQDMIAKGAVPLNGERHIDEVVEDVLVHLRV